ncbi:MAG: class I SAM-dependent methyltransferase [Candidatus Heimdallarchaeota archaeon]
MTCKYCELIRTFDESYPLREATRDKNSDFPRCEWHWRFVCDMCGKPRHFNGVTWCEETRQFICLLCGKDHRFVEGSFWKWDRFYAIGCGECDRRHPALDRLEFQGEHPWQLHSEMLRESTGLSPEHAIRQPALQFLSQDVPVSEKGIADAWNEVAEGWFRNCGEFGDINREYVIDPVIFRLLGQIKGKCILDAGCGNGYLCRLLAKQGAKITGVDISSKAIELAQIKEKEAPLGISYYVGSLSDLAMFSNQTFDVVISNLVLQDLQDLAGALGELYRVLREEGQLLISLLHPCFTGPTVRGWVKRPRDSSRKEDWLFWKIDRYFDRTTEIIQNFGLEGVYYFCRSLSDYITALLQQGFTITDLEEPIPDEKAIEQHYRQFGNEYD